MKRELDDRRSDIKIKYVFLNINDEFTLIYGL